MIFAGDHVVSEGAGDSDGLGPDKTPLLVGIDVVLLVSVCVCVCVCVGECVCVCVGVCVSVCW